MAVKGVQRHKTVTEILIERKTIDEDKLNMAEGEANATNRPLQTVLVDMKLVTAEALRKILSEEWKVEVADLENTDIDPATVKIIPEQMARRHLALPFAKEENTLSVAMADPMDLFVVEDIHTRTGLDIKPMLALPAEIIGNVDLAYGKGGGTLLKKIKEEEQAAGKSFLEDWKPDETGTKGLEVVKDGPRASDITKVDASAPEVEKMVNAIILAAIKAKASDIHIEPFEDPNGKNSRVLLRFRCDGILRAGPFTIPWAYRYALAAKIKIMTNSMNITERRVPQSGRIQVLNQGNPLEFRVEMVPTVYGESCVMRILDRRSVQVDIKKMGFLQDTEDRFLGLLKGIGGKKNFGLILVCGPTGSGKSTTLYGALNYVNRPDIKILTAENPVEYNLDGIVQVPVNPDLKLGEDKKFDFASALRSFLRLDPDVIMVGEIRDMETAHIAMEAAMTGHLVFSTIHTNDAPSSISRLVDMHVPEFMVTATLKAVLAQRLSRRLCPDCKEAHDPTADEIKVYKDNKVDLTGAKLYGPKGCPACNNTGYKGRVGMHELMVMDEELRSFCIKTVSADMVRLAAQKLGMRLIVQDGLEKAKAGLTSVREVLGGTDDAASKVAEAKKPAKSSAATALELFSIANSLNSTLDLDFLLQKIGAAAEDLLDSEASATMLVADDRKSLYFKVASGEKAKALKTMSLPIGQGIAGWVAEHQKPEVVNDTKTDPRFAGKFDKASGFITRSLLCVPMMYRGELVGVVEVLNKRTGIYGPDDISLLNSLASLASVAVTNAKVIAEQKNFFSHVLELLGSVIETAKPAMEGHPVRSAKLACAIGRALGVPEYDYRMLYYAGMLHDLGYVAFNNPAILSEMGIMEAAEEQHPSMSVSMLEGINMIKGALPIIQAHHEKFDGTGFPGKLVGEAIPLGARILQLVECMEEMRMIGLRGAQLYERAVKEAKDGAGKSFDPKVVDVFVDLMQNPEAVW